MSSSSLSRLRGIFSANKISATVPDNELQSIVKKFKKQCLSSDFRVRRAPVYGAIVRRLASAKQFSLIEEIIEHQKQFKNITNESFAIRLISLYGNSGMFTHAQKLFDEMPELKCERTVKSFNALLSACVKAKNFEKIPEIFAHVPEKLSLKPNVVSYNTVLKAFCEMGAFDKLFLVIYEMEKNGVEPNEITFNTLLEAFYSNDKFSDAEKVLEMMKERGMVLNSRSYNPKLRALVANDRISEAEELIEEMKRVGIEPDSFSYNALITGYCDGGNMEEAKKWFGEMKKNGCKPDRVSFVIIGYFACKIGDIDYALELCKEAINEKIGIHKALVQLVVDGLVNASRTEEAKELLELGKSYNKHIYDLKMIQTD